MIIESIQLKNYRNYESLSLSFDAGTNVFYGDNAQGKTNLLEAVFLCGTTKSQRTSKDGDMIRFGFDEAHIRMYVNRLGISRKIDMHLRRGKAKGVAIDGIPIKKASELLKLAGFVFFSPEDLNIIKNGPKERRRFLDAAVSQIDQFYLHDLMAYNKVILQRNKLLKEMYKHPSLAETLDVWDAQLVRFGKRLIRARTRMLEKMNGLLSPIHSKLTAGLEHLEIIYEPSVTEESFEEQLFLSRERDRRMASSTIGPHRDDFLVCAHLYSHPEGQSDEKSEALPSEHAVLQKKIDLRQYGSQGQQRSAALSLKLAEIRLLEEKMKECPILLLDDVLSELDSKRQSCLLQSIGHVQTLITCTGMDELVQNAFPVDRSFHVVNGTIEK